MAWLSDGEKNSKISLFVLAQLTNVTVRQTDRHRVPAIAALMHSIARQKCCVSTDVGTWTNWLTFEPDPDYSPDTGTGLLYLMLYIYIYYKIVHGVQIKKKKEKKMRCNAEFYYVGKSLRTGIGHPSLQRCVVLKWFYPPRAVGTTFFGGTCAPPSALLVLLCFPCIFAARC